MAKGRIAKPKGRLRRFLERPIVYDALLAGAALFATAASAVRAFVATTCADHVAGWLFVVGGALVSLFALAKFIVLWQRQEADESVHELDGCLMVFHTMLSQFLPEKPDRAPRIRVTIHIPDGDNTLVQATNYIGGDGGGIGRVFDKKAGIIGLALKEGMCVYASRKNENWQDYVEDLDKNWGFSLAEAKIRDPASMSWVAVPIGNPVDGILYADSTIKDFFDATEVLQVVAVASIGMAAFLDLKNR